MERTSPEERGVGLSQDDFPADLQSGDAAQLSAGVAQIVLIFGVLLGVAGWWGGAEDIGLSPADKARLPLELRVNINQAGSSELAILPGIGPQLAARIVAHRNENGPYVDMAALDEVPGVGATKLAAIEPYLIFTLPTIDPPLPCCSPALTPLK
jgi:competence ComEA-like helix-hairpin-helix protein